MSANSVANDLFFIGIETLGDLSRNILAEF
jgi:hypothetical protein